MKLVFFDLDGVLTPESHLTQLAKMTGREDEFRGILEKITSETSRKIELEYLAREMFSIFADVPEPILEETGKALPLMKGAIETIDELKKGGYQPILVTNGIEQVARVFSQRAGIAELYANHLEIKGGKTTGRLSSSPLLTLQSKGDLVRNLVTQKSSRKECAAVGNDVNDYAMFQEVGISILFNPSPNLKERLAWCSNREEEGFAESFIEGTETVDVVIERPDLRLLLPILLSESAITS